MEASCTAVLVPLAAPTLENATTAFRETSINSVMDVSVIVIPPKESSRI
jgi:hypothetical protein